MKFLIFAFTLYLVNIASANYLKEKPSFLKSCYLKDGDFKSCYANAFQGTFTEWKDGIPGLKGVGKLDPMHIKRIKLAQSGVGSVSINADMTNVIVKGVSKIVIQDASLNKNMVAKLKVFLPKLRFDSDYKLDGKILALTLNGKGKAFFEAENVQMVVTIPTKLRDQDGFVFCDIQSVKVDIKDISDFSINLENLFNGQKALEESTNALINANWRDYFDTLRGPIEQTIEAVLLDRYRKIFKFVPSTYFVADLPTAESYYG